MDEEMNLTGEAAVTREKLVLDLKALVHDAEDLVKEAAGNVADKSREELTRALERIKASTRRIEERASTRIEETDALIRQHPYQSIGIALGAGLLIGVLINR